MAVFFRADYGGKNKVYILVKTMGLSLRFDLSYEKGKLFLSIKNKRIEIPKKDPEKKLKPVAPDDEIAVFYKDSFKLDGALKGKGIFSFHILTKESIIIIIDLFKNTKRRFYSENDEISMVYKNIPLLWFGVEFKIKLQLGGIILYLIKILKARRKNYGNNF